MAYSHKDTITTKAKNLSALSARAADFISADIMNDASRQFANALTDTEYEAYMDYLETEVYDPTKLHYEMTADERKYDALVTAETYLVLHVLSVALREMDKDVVMHEIKEFGGDEINPVDIDEIISMQEIWKSKYQKNMVLSGIDGSDELSDMIMVAV